MTRNCGAEVPAPFAVPERLQVVDSTNRYLVDLARAGLADSSEVPEGYAVMAERQSEGRGRLGRRWEVPAGTAVLCSILLKPDLGPEKLHLAAWVVALAAADACRASAGVEVWLKWPNDLVAGTRLAGARVAGTTRRRADEAVAERVEAERKVAGILSEILPAPAQDARDRPPRVPGGVVVGIGINVNWPVDWPPTDSSDLDMVSIAARATSLNRVAGRWIDRADLVARFLRGARTWNAMLATDEGRRALASEYRLRSATIGREVQVELADETVAGRALDVDDAGCLLVSTGVCIRTISAGDVVHLR